MADRRVCNAPISPSVTKAIIVCCIIASVLIIYSDRRTPNSVEAPANSSLRSSTNNSSRRIVARFELNGQRSGSRQAKKQVVDILIVFTNARGRSLREKLAIFLTSLFEHSSVPIHLHVVTDPANQEVAVQVLQDASAVSAVNVLVDILHITDVLQHVKGKIEYMQRYFSPVRANYYSDPLFLLSLVLHHVFDSNIQLITLDIDTHVRSDVALLHRHFSLFGDAAVMGLAFEQQPVYHHDLQTYRKHNPDTKCGEPPDKGFPGFNSGVLLLDLGRVRSSALYRSFLEEEAMKNLSAKYFFSPKLGDQDFYTLLACEHPEFFYTLPCTWNRQLCRYWEDHGYRSIFSRYHECEGDVHLYHGNCNSLIPL